MADKRKPEWAIRIINKNKRSLLEFFHCGQFSGAQEFKNRYRIRLNGSWWTGDSKMMKVARVKKMVFFTKWEIREVVKVLCNLDNHYNK